MQRSWLSARIYTFFPTDLTPRLSEGDIAYEEAFVIAISEFRSFVFFLILRGNALSRRLVDYTGDNANVITWRTYRKAGSEWARFLLRILDRCDQPIEFRTYHLYISTFNNVECDNLTRLSEEAIREYAVSKNWTYLDPISIFRFYSYDSFSRRAPKVPTDSARSIGFLHQIAEKRTFMSTHRNIPLNPIAITLGRGTGCWHNILTTTQEAKGINLPRPSETLFPTLSDVGVVNPPQNVALVFSQPPNTQDWNFALECQQKWSRSLMIFDSRPKYELALSMEKDSPHCFTSTWTWEINCSWLVSAQSRKRKVYVSAQKTFPKWLGIPSEVPLPLNYFQLPPAISDFTLESSIGYFSEGNISLFGPDFDNVHELIFLGKLSPTQNGEIVEVDKNDVQSYRLYNSEGVSFPSGGLFPPSGFGHTLFFDPSYQKARALSKRECWILSGSTIISYPVESYPNPAWGKLRPHIDHPEMCFYQLSLVEGLFNYSSYLPPI